MLSLTQGLRRAQQVQGDSLAVVDNEVRYDWNAVADRVAKLASVFRQQGVKEGDRVALLAHNSHRSLEIFFAALWAGAIIAPLNSRLSTEELSQLVDEITPKLLVYGPEFSEIVTSLKIPKRLLANGESSQYEALLDAANALPNSERCGDDIACLFFTGGTTGTPKGVMLSHNNIVSNSVNLITEVGINEHTVHLHCGPLFHVAAAVRLFSVTQVAGRHVIVPRFEAKAVLDVISDEKVTLATLVPTMLQSVLELNAQHPRDLSCLCHITYGAAPMPESLLQAGLRQLPQVEFIQSYGMTETSPIATLLGAKEHRDQEGTKLRSAGKAALLCEVRVVGNRGEVLPPYEHGEITVRGPNVMLGYWNRPEATAEVLKDNWMHTGDIGYLDDDGYLFVVDRLKDVVITGGENVYSQEVENILMQHEGVNSCAVIGLPDERWGERVHAVVVPVADYELKDADIVEHCKSQLAGYKCPKSVTIRQEPLPLSGANKILKPQLRDEIFAAVKQ